MPNDVVECLLKSENPLYLDVNLPDGQSVIVGRSRSTKIKSKRCSKEQVKLTANYKKATVEIIQLGPNPSQVDNSNLRKNCSIIVSEGTILNLLKGEFPYIVTFKRQLSESKFQHSSVNGTDIIEQKQNVPKLNEKSNDQKLISSEIKDEKLNQKKSIENTEKKQTKLEFGETIKDDKTKLKRHGEHNDETTNKHIKLDTEENNSDTEKDQQDLKRIEENLRLMQQQFSIETMNKMPKTNENINKTINTINIWEEEDDGKLFVYTHEKVEAKSKIAAFDLDHTIITTKSGRVFPVDTHDWRIMYSEIPAKLKKLQEEGNKIVIFTNQRNISKGNTDPSDFRKKIEYVTKKLGIPLQVFISTSPGIYRKPAPGMWDILVKKYNQNIPVDLSSSIYVGDAAGRIANWKPQKKKDFSCSDRLFAFNIQVQFYTPEEFFLNYDKVEFKMPLFDPRFLPNGPLAEVIQSTQDSESYPLPLDEDSIISPTPELLILVGFPAAGKSHFAGKYLLPKGYVHINRDTLGSWKKCIHECETSVQKGLNVVIDNTNPDKESRKRYIDIALKYKKPCRCFLFHCSLEQAKHNNMFRLITSKDKSHVGVNDMVLNSYNLKYERPELSEGFNQIVRVNFKPDFKCKEEERLYKMFLIDK
ncbi:uncharacterized protein F21D5.5 [Centruroides vittatus]|uniref:uncharacterized protein F21D5.5 n=1 Tax=Centruroides vittatus TaxID=120091 RepID=UPI00350F6AB7